MALLALFASTLKKKAQSQEMYQLPVKVGVKQGSF